MFLTGECSLNDAYAAVMSTCYEQQKGRLQKGNYHIRKNAAQWRCLTLVAFLVGVLHERVFVYAEFFLWLTIVRVMCICLKS